MLNRLPFFNPYLHEQETLYLSSGKKVAITKYFLKFKKWNGKPVPDSYGNKTVINFNGEPVFAELAVLRLFQSNAWDGVWVDSYRRKFRAGLPGVVEPVRLSSEQERIIESIKSRTGRLGGCWDVFVWKDNQFLFLELKRNKKDKIQDSQRIFLKAALEIGLTIKNFVLVEWDLKN